MRAALEVQRPASGSKSSFRSALQDFLGTKKPRIPLDTTPRPVEDLAIDAELAFFLARSNGRVAAPAVKAGDEIQPGQVLFTGPDDRERPSPVRGKVAAIRTAPDVGGGKAGLAVAVEPGDPPDGPAFDPLPESAAPEALRERLREAALLTAELAPRLLADRLEPCEALIVLAADREPAVSVVSQLLRDRSRDAARAAALLGRIAGARRTLLAVLGPLASEVRPACAEQGVEVLELPPEYPQTLEPMVVRRAGVGSSPVIPLETALAGLDAVVEGKIQAFKVLTVIGPKGSAIGNYRVPLGTRLEDVLAAVRLHAGGRDRVVAGGPMRGLAQYSLGAAVDTSLDAIVVMRDDQAIPWSDEPCINCGACIDACPSHLQVQLIGRYSEFSLFENTRALDIDACIECGLCATVCTSRRPLLQLIRLAKREIAPGEASSGTGS